MTKAQFKKLKKGQKLKFTKACLQWTAETAFESHSVRGGINKENLNSYLVDLFITTGNKYTAKFIGYSPNCPEDTLHVEINCGGLIDSSYYDYKDLKLK